MFPMIFVKHQSGVGKESNKPYNIVELSDGVRSAVAQCALDESHFQGLKEGDAVRCSFDVKIRQGMENKNSFSFTLTGIEPA